MISIASFFLRFDLCRHGAQVWVEVLVHEDVERIHGEVVVHPPDTGAEVGELRVELNDDLVVLHEGCGSFWP